jgi:hypothetical protein
MLHVHDLVVSEQRDDLSAGCGRLFLELDHELVKKNGIVSFYG